MDQVQQLSERIITTMRVIEAVRDQVKKNGGKYTGQEIPNMQTAIDTLSMPDGLWQTQKGDFPPGFVPSPMEIQILIHQVLGF